MIGTRIHQYTITDKLGAGGMGEVFLAEDTRLGRNVALKFLPERFSSDPEFKSRFEHEARAAAALNHPNIITVHDLGEHEGRLYIAMEHVPGRTLAELIDADEMAARQAAMGAICGACHSTDWVDGHFAQFDAFVAEVDDMVLQTTAMMDKAWKDGLADPANPFDEALEHLWVNQWLINANAARYASAMNGQDFAAFKYGWWGMSQTMAKMHEKLKEQK